MNGTLDRLFGGSPLRVLLQLVVVSVIVGALLSIFGLNPFDLVESVRRLVQRIWDAGFGTFEWVWRYFLLGAVVVLPIWLILRLMKVGRRAGP